MATVHYGPWLGEFGFELAWWSPSIRYLAAIDHAHGDKVVVSSHPSVEHLYEFADEFVPLDVERHVAWCGRLLSPSPAIKADRQVEWLDLFPDGWRKPPPCQHRMLGVSPISDTDVMVAFRPPKGDQGKEYPPDLCERLVASMQSKGLSVGSYGGPDNWHFGGADYRGQPLGRQCSLLAGARCAVGPSSGTMHLAALCGLPYVTWYNPRPEHSEDVHGLWNHFGVDIAFLRGCNPEPDTVVDAALRMIRPL